MKSPAALSERNLKIGGYKKPMSRFDPWVSPAAADAAYEEAMEIGSRSLLSALWREHPGQMRFARAAGRQVVQP